MERKFTKRIKIYIALALSVLVILVAAGLSLVAANPAADPIKNAYLNGAIAPDNGTSAAPVIVAAGDNITYELTIEKPDLKNSGGQYDVLFVLDWSGSMALKMGTYGQARIYARNLVMEMSKYIFENYPDSRIALLGHNASQNCYNNPAYLYLQYDTPFVGASSYESVIATSFTSSYPYYQDDNGQALKAAIDKMSGNKSASYMGNKKVVPRDELDSGRTPIIVMISDFVMTEHSGAANHSGQKYWSKIMKKQADRYNDLYPDGILMTVRLDYKQLADYSTPEYDNLMTTYLSPAGRSHWSFTKIPPTISPDDAFKMFQGVFTASAPIPKKMMVTDVIPNGMTILSTTPAATVTGQKVEWDLTGQPAGAYTLSVAVQVDTPLGSAIIDYHNTATVSIEGETDTTSNTTYHRLGESAAVVTGDADNITQNSATIVNNTYANIAGTISNIGIQFGTDPSLVFATTVRGTTIGSPFAVDLTGLQPDTTYSYRAVVQSSTGVLYGDIKTFVTPSAVPTPVVVTGDAGNITQNSATIANNTYAGITGTINNVGIQYSTNATLTAATTVRGTTIGSPFTVNLTGLQPNTTYYYRAGVQTSSGMQYGDIKSFVTPNVVQTPVVVTGDASNITQNSATIIDNTYSGITGTINNVGIQYSTNATLTAATTARGTTIGSPFAVDLIGLQPNTTYYYRAGVQSASGMVFGDIKTFTTPAQTLNVVTGSPIDVVADSALIIDNTYAGISGTINFVAIQYSTNPSLTSATVVRETVSVGSPFYIQLTGLQPQTTYYYRAGVQSSAGSYYGQIESFTTPEQP